MTSNDCTACAARADLSFGADNERDPPKGSALLFEYHQGERYACPDCGRLYLRTLTNADVPFLHRDVDEYSFQKLSERVAPRARAPLAPRPLPGPVETELKQVFRCPKCRSTRISQGTWMVTDDDDVRMECGACRHEEVVAYPGRTGWSVLLRLPKGRQVVMDFVSPQDEAAGAAPPDPPAE